MTTLSWIRGVNGTLGHLAPEHVAGKMPCIHDPAQPAAKAVGAARAGQR